MAFSESLSKPYILKLDEVVLSELVRHVPEDDRCCCEAITTMSGISERACLATHMLPLMPMLLRNRESVC